MLRQNAHPHLTQAPSWVPQASHTSFILSQLLAKSIHPFIKSERRPPAYLFTPLVAPGGYHLAMTGEPRGFSRVTAGFSSYDGEFRLPLVLAQASPIFHSSCEGKLGIALE